MKICFTGHRDRFASLADLDTIAASYPGATWIHGGARGFDGQVDAYARTHKIAVEVVRPDYSSGDYKYAPLARNKHMVDAADIVVACYDGRTTGGTWFTIDYADKQGKNVIVIQPIE